jgi:hypothetical protein
MAPDILKEECLQLRHQKFRNSGRGCPEGSGSFVIEMTARILNQETDMKIEINNANYETLGDGFIDYRAQTNALSRIPTLNLATHCERKIE